MSKKKKKSKNKVTNKVTFDCDVIFQIYEDFKVISKFKLFLYTIVILNIAVFFYNEYIRITEAKYEYVILNRLRLFIFENLDSFGILVVSTSFLFLLVLFLLYMIFCVYRPKLKKWNRVINKKE